MRLFTFRFRGRLRYVELKNKTIKRMIASFLALLLLLSIVACESGKGIDNRISVPSSSSELKGKDYKDVINLLQTAGFRNIETEVLDDLIVGWLTKDGEVEKVSINGDTIFSSGIKYPDDANIVVTYHTFSLKETKAEPETTEKPKVTEAQEASRVSNTRNISGFDIKTNNKINWCGIEFSFPSYFDVLEKGATETFTTYYPKREDCYASIIFQSKEFSSSQEDFKNRIPSIIEGILSTEYFADTEIQKSEEISIAGLPGWTFTFSKSDKKEDAIISKGNCSFVYNQDVGKIAIISCIYDSKDQSKYDYLGDFKKVLETAKLEKKASAIKENVPPSQANKGIEKQITTESIDTNTKVSYIGNRNTKKFHRVSCSYLPDPKNQVKLNSREEAVNNGYIPCKKCNP